MPRSPLRRPPADLDFSRWLILADALPTHVSSESVFGNTRPLELEIGSGKGLFLSRAAIEAPETNYLGIEIAGKFAEHVAARLAKSNVSNARIISGNAEPIFANRIPARSLAGVHVYFPDPWWKAKHRKRRVLNETSVRHIASALSPGGRFHFWTDVLDYFEETIEMIAIVAPELGVPFPEVTLDAKDDMDYRTHFERRSRRHRIPVYRVYYRRLD